MAADLQAYRYRGAIEHDHEPVAVATKSSLAVAFGAAWVAWLTCMPARSPDGGGAG
jgi:hypothetical protein